MVVVHECIVHLLHCFLMMLMLPVKKKKDQCHKSAFFLLSQFLSMQSVLRYRRVMVLGLSFPEGSFEKNFLEAH